MNDHDKGVLDGLLASERGVARLLDNLVIDSHDSAIAAETLCYAVDFLARCRAELILTLEMPRYAVIEGAQGPMLVRVDE